MHGFNREPSLRTVHNTCNVSDLERLADGAKTIDLAEHGIDKLLGSGRISSAITVSVEHWSAKAAEKLISAGGSIEGSKGDDEWDEE
jgi:large subunit ribosomal protein L15